MQEMEIQSLGLDDPQEMQMKTNTSTLAWEMPRTEESGGVAKSWT